MGQLVTGLIFVIFGLVIGGVGIATAGIGIGIPMIPIGIYLIVRGIRSFYLQKQQEKAQKYLKPKAFESSRFGRAMLGVLLVIVGAATSTLLIGIPVLIVGVLLIYFAFKKREAGA